MLMCLFWKIMVNIIAKKFEEISYHIKKLTGQNNNVKCKNI